MNNNCLQRIEVVLLGLFRREGKGMAATEGCDNVHFEEGPSEGD